MGVIITTVIGSIILTFLIARWTNKIVIAYVMTFILVNGIYYIHDIISSDVADPFMMIGLVVRSTTIIVSSFLAHIIWVLYCLQTGKNVTHQDGPD